MFVTIRFRIFVPPFHFTNTKIEENEIKVLLAVLYHWWCFKRSIEETRKSRGWRKIHTKELQNSYPSPCNI